MRSEVEEFIHQGHHQDQNDRGHPIDRVDNGSDHLPHPAVT